MLTQARKLSTQVVGRCDTLPDDETGGGVPTSSATTRELFVLMAEIRVGVFDVPPRKRRHYCRHRRFIVIELAIAIIITTDIDFRRMREEPGCHALCTDSHALPIFIAKCGNDISRR